MFAVPSSKKTLLLLCFLLTSVNVSYSRAELLDPSGAPQTLVAGFSQNAFDQMAKAPLNQPLTTLTNTCQATYLSPANPPLIGGLTQELLKKTTNVGSSPANDIISFTWQPNTKKNQSLEQDPLSSADINSLLEPITYNETQSSHAKNVMGVLAGSLTPITPVNFSQLLANLRGSQDLNLRAKLQEKQTQQYLGALRNYMVVQTMALGNLYQLYMERKPLDVNQSQQIKALANQLGGPVSRLGVENYMATRRILNEQWPLQLINENPATLLREQVQLAAENLAETYQTRMTLERLLATMSVLVLELNQQARGQLATQIQQLNNPQRQPGQ